MLKQLRCPSCGAQLDPPPANATEVACVYCGVTAALERPRVPKQGRPPVRQGMPVAQYKLPRWAYIFYVLPFAGVLLGIGGAIYGVISGQAPGLGGILQWSSGAPLELCDVNGDGKLDVVGRVNTFEKSEQVVHFAAYDGIGGHELWRTTSFGTFSEEHSAKSRVVGDVVVAGDSRGQLHAFALADGQPRWKVSLGEQVDHLCPGGDGEAIVVTADEVTRVVSLADGAFRPGDAPADCDAPPRTPGTYGITDDGGAFRDNAVEPWLPGEGDPAVEPAKGMRIDRGFTASGELHVALGIKEPGTRVPMVAVYRGEDLLWASPIPTGDPLAAEEGDDGLAVLRDGVLVTTYAVKGADQPGRLVARDVERGAVRWDVEIPHSGEVSSGPRLMAASASRVFVAHWTWLEAFDLGTGEHLYTIGRWR
jgi:hypothetical protein